MPQQEGPGGALTQARRRVRGLQRQSAQILGLMQQLRDQQRQLWSGRQAMQRDLAPLIARQTQLAAENLAQPLALRVRLRMDAGFCNSETLTALVEAVSR